MKYHEHGKTKTDTEDPSPSPFRWLSTRTLLSPRSTAPWVLAVTAVWLFFNVWLSNSLQARYSGLLIPTILYNIFVIVQYTSCSRFTTWTQCWDLIYLTVQCYYTGVAISFVSGILIYPVSCRTEFFEVTEKYIESLHGMLSGTAEYLKKLPLTSDTQPTTDDEKSPGELYGRGLRERMTGVKALYVQMHEKLPMAKREIAWGYYMPRISHLSNPCDFDISEPNSDYQGQHRREYEKIWQSCMESFLEPAVMIIEAINQGLEHAALQLEIIPPPGKKGHLRWFSHATQSTMSADVESGGDEIKPGNPAFSKMLEQKLADFLARKSEYLDRPDERTTRENADSGRVRWDREKAPFNHHTPRNRKQLYLLLYMQHMLYTAGISVLQLCKFSDDIIAAGIMSKSGPIIPPLITLVKWFSAIFDTADAALPDDERPRTMKEQTLLFGIAGKVTRNIEHLPPRNAYERLGVCINRFQQFLRGPEFSFGFRSACATMSCAILAYLHQTQEIFTHYRLIWSVIISAIGANMSAGQSGLSDVLRILGSFAALIICYAVWYIPNGHVAGVIVIMWLASFFQMYFLIRWPKYIIGWLVILITEVLSIGYELQVKKIVKVNAESTGIYVFPPYYVAALRVACVLGLLRKDMAVVIQLLANYHAVVHSTIKVRLLGKEGDVSEKHSHGDRMARTRKAMFNKIMTLSVSINHNVYLQKYEPSLGGRFPVAIFKDIISQLTNLLDLISLLSYSTQVWEVSGVTKYCFAHSPENAMWLSDLSKLIEPINPIEEGITSILCQLSAAVSTGRALPPHMRTKTPYRLSERLRTLDPEILHLDHMLEPGYSAHAVMEIISSMATYKIDRLVSTVEDLVGVISWKLVIDGLMKHNILNFKASRASVASHKVNPAATNMFWLRCATKNF
ncbi:hypothetical protein H4I96_07827 [Botrytis cinerea]